MNVPAVALIALMIAIAAAIGTLGLFFWALDANPKAIRQRHARRAFICPCGHDFVFHSRQGGRQCLRKGIDGYGQCTCQGYSAEIPLATLTELLDGGVQ